MLNATKSFEIMDPLIANNSKILLVDDEQDILEMLAYNLEKEGFTIYLSNNGKSAVIKALEVKPHLIIMDIMMPEMDGVETCKRIKNIDELKHVMVAFLTARSEEYSEIACLEAGADDFIKKPVRPRLFIARVNALLRRYYLLNEIEISPKLIYGDLEINISTYQIFKNQKEIYLTKKEFDLIYLLMSNPRKVFLRNEIFNRVWGEDIMVGERTIDVHISKLREKLGKDYIDTIKKVGYRFQIQ